MFRVERRMATEIARLVQDMKDMHGFEVIDETRRYVLGESEGHYGVWDKTDPSEPLDRFPITAAGFEAAAARFSELARRDIERRESVPKALSVAIWIGVAIWVVAGLISIAGATNLFRFQGAVPMQVAHILDALGFRIAIGGFIVLGTLVLRRWERRAREGLASTRPGFSGAETRAPASRSGGQRLLLWLMGVAMAAWIVTAVPSQALFPWGDAFTPELPSPVFVAAQVIQSVAFRLWVVAFLLLLVGWGRRWLPPGGTNDRRMSQG